MGKSENILVSVVVPVYNVEAYIDRCVGSLTGQTYENIEIILIDDGSSDGSGFICDGYAESDERIKAMHKKNGGLSDARNHGLKVAGGEYVIFVDSDDYIELDAVEKMVNHVVDEKLDVVSCDMNRLIFVDDEAEYRKDLVRGGVSHGRVMSGKEYLVDCIRKREISVSPCTRMYRLNLIKENGLYFKDGIFHEDEHWTPRVLIAAERVAYYSFPVYNYMIRRDSITQTDDRRKHIEDVMRICEDLESVYDSIDLSDYSKKVLGDYLARLYINTCTYGTWDKRWYESIADKKFSLKNSYFLRTRIESLIYFMDTSLYRYIKLKLG